MTNKVWRMRTLRAPSMMGTVVVLLLFYTTFAVPSTPAISGMIGTIGANTVYGASATVGQALEPCETEQNLPNAKVLSPTDAWQSKLEQANPGETYLLHGGIYQASDKLELPAGLPGQPITIKPYNCEAVSIFATLRPNSHNVIAGLHLEAKGVSDTKWVIRVDGRDGAHFEKIILRNNNIWGGTIDAIRLNDDVINVTLSGNHIDGGGNGHGVFVTSEDKLILPDQIDITNNYLSKRYFDTPAEDMFQVRDVLNVRFTHNTCTEGRNMEQCIDIKSVSAPLVITHNFIDGEKLQQIGYGEDLAGGCMVIHEDDDLPDSHIIEDNLFYRCKGTIIRFGTGPVGEVSSGTLQRNLFVQASGAESLMTLFQASDVKFINNTMVYGQFKLGDASGSRTPRNTVIKNNIFYQTMIEDNSQAGNATYQCSYNLLYQTSGDGFTQGCSNTITDDPLFVNVAGDDYHLQPNSPARGKGEGGVDLGAVADGAGSVVTPTFVPTVVIPADVVPKIYLPMVRKGR